MTFWAVIMPALPKQSSSTTKQSIPISNNSNANSKTAPLQQSGDQVLKSIQQSIRGNQSKSNVNTKQAFTKCSLAPQRNDRIDLKFLSKTNLT